MRAMLDLVDALGSGALPLFWLPLAAWTILLAVVALVLQAASGVHPLLRYRMAQGCLFALPIGVLVAGVLATASQSVPVVAGLPAITVVVGQIPNVDTSAGALPTWAPSLRTLVGVGTLAALVAAALAVIRLLADAFALQGFGRQLRPTEDPDSRLRLRELQGLLGVRRRVRLLAASRDTVPMTKGILCPAIVIPAGLDPAARRLALAHELVHVRQHDVLGQCLERVVAALFAIHPAVHWLRRLCALLREMSCDAALLAEARADRRSYADLLFGYADAGGRLLAPSVADRRSHIHKRISLMSNYNRLSWSPPRAAVLFALFTVLIAGSLAVAIPRLAAGPMPEADFAIGAPVSDTVFVVVEEMPRLVGGLEALQERLQYPPLARQAGIEGTVFVQFVVNSDGSVSELLCTRHPGAGTCEAAIAAIRGSEFRPGRQRDVAVPVRFSLPVRFRLGQDDPQDSLGTDALNMRMEHLETRFTQTEVGIRGRVFADGAPVAGASIVVGETTFGAATDEAGFFHVRMPFDRIAEAGELVATHHRYGVTRIALNLPRRFAE